MSKTGRRDADLSECRHVCVPRVFPGYDAHVVHGETGQEAAQVVTQLLTILCLAACAYNM